MGELSWKLNEVQKKLKARVDNDTTKTSVVVVSRRTGKTYWLIIEALMQCLRQPGSVVKFVFPKQKDAKTNIKPLMRMITEDCPEHLKPKYNTQDKIYTFHNDSEIQLAGCDNGNIEGIRGGFAHLCIVDEAGFCDDLKYAIRSVLSPTIRTTKGRIIMASTPSKSPDHEFVTDFMIPYKASGRLEIFTIYDNPNFDEEDIKDIIADYPMGVEDSDFKREYLCEIAVDQERAIFPEFQKNKDNIIFKEGDIETPPCRDFYVSFDVGFRDLTAGLFGYYDFKKGCLVILDELILNGPEMTTDRLAKDIKHMEELRFFDKSLNQPIKPYMRVMDNALSLINDLTRLHNIYFIPTKKDNKEAQVNNARIWLIQGRLKVHERCKHLLYHLEYGQWDKKRVKFSHLSDSPCKTIKGGHVDTLDSLVYLIRNVNENKNPYPSDFGSMRGPNVFNSPRKKSEDGTIKDLVNRILNRK